MRVTFLQRRMMRLALVMALSGSAGVWAEMELTEYRGVVLADSAINDGDSFFVRMPDGREMHLRLYFVDSPETKVGNDHVARRVQEQARYFGIDTPERIMWLGEQAAAFTREVLSQPFTVYTAHARALGGGSSHRIYGFVVTAAGRDLGELLVENGFGRNFGVKRGNYRDVDAGETELYLRDLEAAAMLARRGIWSESNAARLAEYRARQRREREAIETIMTSTVVLREDPVNVNTASQYDLERVPGVGPVTAGRIIEFRPYAAVEELKQVPGIGDRTLERMRPFIRVEPTATNG